MRLFVLLTALLMLFSGRSVAQTDGITIITPVTGDFAIANLDGSLHIVNTITGSMTTVSNAEIAESVERLYWDHSGSRIVYRRPDDTVSWYDTNAQALEIRTVPASDFLLFPLGWSLDDQSIFLLGVADGSTSSQLKISIYRYTVSDSGLTVVASYDTDTSISYLPGLNGQAPYNNFGALGDVSLNPVYNDWIVGDYESVDGEMNLLLHNLVTQQAIQLQPFFPNEKFYPPFLWSPDGTKLIMETTKLSPRQFLIHLMNFDGIGGVALKSSAEIDLESSVVAGWLGIDDIFIRVGRYSSSPNTRTYFLNQIIDGTLYTQEFFSVNDNVYTFGRGDFHLRADEAEKHQLSCLFDQALPTQLSIGARARVNFTDGTPLRLRDAPSFDANEITQMPEGTEFDIIGGKACVNADSYTRFWEVQLDDGTIGWAAEANLTDYFMEPVPVD